MTTAGAAADLRAASGKRTQTYALRAGSRALLAGSSLVLAAVNCDLGGLAAGDVRSPRGRYARGSGGRVG